MYGKKAHRTNKAKEKIKQLMIIIIIIVAKNFITLAKVKNKKKLNKKT